MGSSSSTGRRNDQVLPPRPFPPPITTSYPLILLLSPPPPPPPSPPPIPVTPTTRPPPSPPPTPVSPATRPPPPPPPTLVSLPARPPPPPPPTPVSPATSPRQPPPPTHVSPATRPPPPPPPTPVSPATSPRPPPPPTHVSPATRPPPPPPPTPVSLAARPRPPPPPTPLPPATRPPPPPPPSSSHNANYPAPSLPPPPLPSFVFVANTPYFPSYAPNYPHYFHYLCFSDGGYSLPYAVSGQSSHLYYMNPRGGCPYPQPVPFYPGPPLRPTPRHVDHNEATTIRNDVNLRKDTIRMEVDEQNPDHHLVTFTFDSTVDGSFTVFYMAKEGEECSFSPQDPEVYKPVKVSFEKGLGQKFCQPSGTGIDLGFFSLDDLNKPSPDEVYPLVISAEACSVPSGTEPHAQITLAVIVKKESEQFQVKVIKQILWIDGVRYELQEIYGIGSSSTSEFDDDTGKECVICMSERRNTAVMPCRHMCMCSECAEILSHQSNRCPICRKPVEQLMEIKV